MLGVQLAPFLFAGAVFQDSPASLGMLHPVSDVGGQQFSHDEAASGGSVIQHLLLGILQMFLCVLSFLMVVVKSLCMICVCKD